MTIKRFSSGDDRNHAKGLGMLQADDGEWVKWEDVRLLLQAAHTGLNSLLLEADYLRGTLNQLGHPNCPTCGYPNPCQVPFCPDCVVEIKETRN